MGASNTKVARRAKKIPSRKNSVQTSSTEQSSEETSDDTSETKKFKYIEGRRFHNWPDIHYDLPNDDDEGNILNLMNIS
jgi:hypothetical protein